MGKHKSANNVNNISGEDYDERGSGIDKNSWKQAVTGQKMPQEGEITLN